MTEGPYSGVIPGESLPGPTYEEVYLAGGGLSRPNVPVTCVESLAVPAVGFGIASCDPAGDVVCTFNVICGFHYRDPDNCYGVNCNSNDTAKVVTSSYPFLLPSWISCSIYSGTPLGVAFCAVRAGVKAAGTCSRAWPAPTPGGICAWATVP